MHGGEGGGTGGPETSERATAHIQLSITSLHEGITHTRTQIGFENVQGVPKGEARAPACPLAEKQESRSGRTTAATERKSINGCRALTKHATACSTATGELSGGDTHAHTR